LNTKENSKETDSERKRVNERERERERSDQAAVANLFIKYKKAQIVSMNLCEHANIFISRNWSNN